jgi:hypothetical protein
MAPAARRTLSSAACRPLPQAGEAYTRSRPEGFMPNITVWRVWLLLAAVITALAAPIIAHAADGGGGGATDDEDDVDDDPPLKTKKGGGKVPSHFEIKPWERLGFRHAFDPNFSLEVFVRGQQNVLDNPLSLRTTFLSGGLQSAYKVGATTWYVTLEARQVYSQFYDHTVRTEYLPRTMLQQEINLGSSGFAVTPAAETGYQTSDDSQQDRWKFKAYLPLSYKLSKSLILFPFYPQLAFQSFTHRTDGRQDWTLTLLGGIRYFFTPSSYVETDFGYENRWSNVGSAEFSRWKLLPQLSLRIDF